MIMKFEKTGDLGVLPGREWKQIATDTVEEGATDEVEKASSSIYSSASDRSVSPELEIPWSTVQKILRSTLKWYPYKIQVMQTLKPQDHKTRLEFACRFWMTKKAEISKNSAHAILLKDLKMRSGVAEGMFKLLSAEHKELRLEAAQELLDTINTVLMYLNSVTTESRLNMYAFENKSTVITIEAS
ncbi:uncharacterized protein TNCV_2743021 [Trichonephila clavipes]|nr:uncharacterized protein TNCV_2743021 [Trichonephila clavipes]